MIQPYYPLLTAVILIGTIIILFWPGWGVYHRWRRNRQNSQRVYREDALKQLHRAERSGSTATVQSVAGQLQISADETSLILADMEQQGLLQTGDGHFRLTPEGREAALHIIRAHRLWERYLADRTGYSEQEWHAQAEALEHQMLPHQTDALAAQLGHPTHDPHGDPIPTATGDYHSHGGVSLLTLSEGEAARIVHLEDEPPLVFSQLVAIGLHPGQEIQILEKTTQRVRFWAGGDEHVLAPLLASNISVVPIAQLQEDRETAGDTLTSLKIGDVAEVVAISRRCRSPERRRLMDLGIVPGVVIEAAFVSPTGDPTAYRVRNTLIALRQEQAEMVTIQSHDLEPASSHGAITNTIEDLL